MVIIAIKDNNGRIVGYVQTVGYDAMHDLMMLINLPEGYTSMTLINDSDH